MHKSWQEAIDAMRKMNLFRGHNASERKVCEFFQEQADLQEMSEGKEIPLIRKEKEFNEPK